MAIQNISGNLVLPNLYAVDGSGVFTFTSFPQALNSATTRIGVVIRVPKSGTLDWFEWRTGLVGNQPDNGVRLSFQTVDATGLPDNTEDQYVVMPQPFTANSWQVPAAYMGTGGGGSGSKRTVTAGEYLACVLRLENFVASDTLNVAMVNGQLSYLSANGLFQTGYTSTNSGTVWSAATCEGLIIALRYDDGTYGFCQSSILPISAINTRNFNSSSTPDERGLLFQVPFVARLKGFIISYDPNGVAHDFVLYNSAGSVLETVTGLLYTGSAGAGGYTYYEFASPHDLAINSNYRLTLLPGGSNVLMWDLDFNSSAIRAAVDGGSTWMSTSRTNGGAWTDTDTNRPVIHLVFGGFDDGVGGGGGEHSAVF